MNGLKKLINKWRGYSQVRGTIVDFDKEILKVHFRTYRDGRKTIVWDDTEYLTDNFEYPTGRFLGTLSNIEQ